MFTELFWIIVLFIGIILAEQIRIAIPINRFQNRYDAAVNLSYILVNNLEELKRICEVKNRKGIILKAGIYKIKINKDKPRQEVLKELLFIIIDVIEQANQYEILKTSKKYENLVVLKKELTMELWTKYDIKPNELL